RVGVVTGKAGTYLRKQPATTLLPHLVLRNACHLAEGHRMRNRQGCAQFRSEGEKVLNEVILVGVSHIQRQCLAHEQFGSNLERTCKNCSSSNRGCDDGRFAPHRRLRNECPLTIWAKDWTTSKVLPVGILR